MNANPAHADFIDLDDLDALPPLPAGSGATWPNGFSMRPGGFYFSPKDDGDPKLLSAPFQILGMARDPGGQGWALALEWRDLDGELHHAFVAKADLLGDGVEVFRPLASGGLSISHDASRLKLLKAALAGVQCAARVRLVSRAGWHGNTFVMPNRTIGETEGESFVFQGRAEAARYAEAGTVEEWREQVAAPAAGNSRLVLAISTAFAGALCDLLQFEGGGFHLVGASSLGKSTALLVAGSVWGGGGRAGFCQPWRGTDNGHESIARAHSGTFLALDELGEVDPKSAGAVAYMLINGASKIRATKDADTRARAEWRVMLLSSGELTLADKIGEGGRRARAGQLVRLVDVPADTGRGLGLFEDCKGMEPAAFSEAIKGAALRIYGTAGPAFVEALASDPASMEKGARTLIKKTMSKLLDGIAPDDGQAYRVASRFAVVAAAGEMARAALDLPWPEGEAERAAAVCFEAWRGDRGGDGPGELVAALGAVRAAVERHAESRFRNLDAPALTGEGGPGNQGPIRDLLGYRFTHPEAGLVWGFTSTGWAETLAGIGKGTAIASMLSDRGFMVMSGGDRAGRLVKKIDGRALALYAVKASALDTGAAR